MNVVSDYHREQAQRRAAHVALGRRLAVALSEGMFTQPWMCREEPDYEASLCLDRADGLTLTLYWSRSSGSKPELRPKVPLIPGSNQERSDLSFSFSPARPIEQVAREAKRRIIEPWEEELPRIRERHAKTLAERADTLQRAAELAEALGTRLREDSGKQVIDNGEVRLGIGMYSWPIDVDVKVSTYSARTEFKIELRNRQDVALEIAALLRERTMPKEDSLVAQLRRAIEAASGQLRDDSSLLQVARVNWGASIVELALNEIGEHEVSHRGEGWWVLKEIAEHRREMRSRVVPSGVEGLAGIAAAKAAGEYGEE